MYKSGYSHVRNMNSLKKKKRYQITNVHVHTLIKVELKYLSSNVVCGMCVCVVHPNMRYIYIADKVIFIFVSSPWKYIYIYMLSMEETRARADAYGLIYTKWSVIIIVACLECYDIIYIYIYNFGLTANFVQSGKEYWIQIIAVCINK